MAEYIKREVLVDLVLGKLKFMGDARIMNENDEKVLSEIDGYEKAIYAVHELLLDKDLIEDIQPVKSGEWICNEELYYNGMAKCSCCNAEFYVEDLQALQGDAECVKFCPNCGADMIEPETTKG